MKAMILAAGRGERLRPLTDKLPKPLISVAGKALIEYHLENLAAAGIDEVVINTAWLADKIHRQLGDGSRYNIDIIYSDEGQALETAGGIIKALPLLGDAPFLVINGDIHCDYPFKNAIRFTKNLPQNILAHLILVNNPEHNHSGDFALNTGIISNTGQPMYTFSGIGIYQPAFFSGQSTGHAALAPLIRQKCQQQQVSGELFSGHWTDVGTLERLQQLEQLLSQATAN